MPKQGTLIISIENGDIANIEDALPFNEGISVSKKNDSKFASVHG